MTTLADICRDLDYEQRELDALVADLHDGTWDLPTPAEGWTIRDQISHLAFFDEVGAQAASDPEGFTAQLADIAADPPRYMDRAVQRGRSLAPAEVLEWWRSARTDALQILQNIQPGERIAWFGPPMKPISFVTGRLMETWAHGQDIVDTLGVRRAPTQRLRHIAHMGIAARGFSFHVNGRVPPAEDVRVELRGPDGDAWAWGSSSGNVVRGDAEDFCLAVTQRRHVLDTDLEIEGSVATSWMEIAQSFAGPPGSGRRPGQFPKRTTA